MKRTAIAIVAVMAVMSVVLVSEAAAHRVKFDTTLTAKYNKPKPKDPYAVGGFDGAVTSAKARCEKKRTVTLLMRTAAGGTTVVGTDVSDATGAWAITPSATAAPGTYFAKVRKKVLRKNAKHRHICRKAVSKDVTVK